MIQFTNNESLETKFGRCYALQFSFFKNSKLSHCYFISIEIILSLNISFSNEVEI